MSAEPDTVDLFALRLPAYLVSLSDGPENCLVVVIEEATGLGPPPDPIQNPSPVEKVLNEIRTRSQAIVPGPGDRIVEISWACPISYAVTEETFALPERDGSIADGRVIRLINDSWFDDFVNGATWASDEFPGPKKHYSVVTNNHCINVVSANEPVARLISIYSESTR